MLTDYHVHLRPDREDATAERYFTPSNAERYRETAAERGIEELGVSEHVHRFSQALEVWENPWYRHWAVDDLDEYARFVREDTDLRLGIEADFLPGREDRLANLLDGRPWDYVVGSLHFLRDEAVDLHGAAGWEALDIWRSRDPEKVWRGYFETLGELARCGLFDIMAHPDLVKVWGGQVPRPDGDLRRFYELAMDGIAESDVAIEVSTAGWRKPVGEIYPGPGVPGDVPGRRAAGGAVERRPRARASRLRVRARGGVAGRCRGERAGGVRAPRAPDGGDRMTVRTGIGFDSHRLEEGRRLILGGVEIPFDRGLAGHSDADVLTHAVIDALLGAAGLDDIGAHFPDTDERWRDADSLDLLRQVRVLLDERGLVPANVDAVVVCEAPRLGAHRASMRERLAEALGVPEARREREVHHG